MMNMYNVLKKTILYTVVFILLIALAGAVCYADTPPASEEYIPCPIYVNDQLIDDTAYTYKGNIYVSISTIQKYGQTDFIEFDTPHNRIYFNPRDIDIFAADQETSQFLWEYCGWMSLPISYFYGVNHLSLGSVSNLCKLDYRYENGQVFISPYTGQEENAPESHKYNVYGEAREKDTFDTPINLIWQMANNITPLAPGKTDNIDVMSPIWLRTEIDAGGGLFSVADYGYVELCHANDIKVWICVNNGFDVKGGAKYANDLLSDWYYRNRLAAQMIMHAVMYNADGINVDFESMDHDLTKTVFNDLIATLYHHCSKLGLTLSVDTMLASEYWSTIYNFELLGQNADYICPMTYNEHWTLSVGPGSTMSRNYYTSNTDRLLRSVPADKVLMGVPLFTQVWEVWPSGEPRFLWTVSAKRALELVAERDAVPVWYEYDGQFIASYPGRDYPSDTIKIWIEDERSMANKLAYVLDRGIAGTACWAMNQQYDGMLDVFGKVYKQGADPLTIPGYYYDPNFAVQTDTEDQSSSEGTDTQTPAQQTDPETPAPPESQGSYAKGDFNGDGSVNSNDLTDLSRYIAMIIDVEDEDLIAACDVDGSGTVDSNDLTILSRYVAMIIDSFDTDQTSGESPPE